MSEILKINQLDPLYPKNLLKTTVPDKPIKLARPLWERTEQGKPSALYATAPFSNDKNTSFLAAIGSRAITVKEQRIVFNFLKEFYSIFGQEYPIATLTIVSGMTQGGDALAHSSALHENIQTIGVSATSINHLHPYGDNFIFTELQNENTNGAIISEYESADKPIKAKYLDRNRIVAWMSGSVLAFGIHSVKSGAMHTVSLARHASIPVYFIEGTVSNLAGKALKMRGATGVKNAKDFIEKIQKS